MAPGGLLCASCRPGTEPEPPQELPRDTACPAPGKPAPLRLRRRRGARGRTRLITPVLVHTAHRGAAPTHVPRELSTRSGSRSPWAWTPAPPGRVHGHRRHLYPPPATPLRAQPPLRALSPPRHQGPWRGHGLKLPHDFAKCEETISGRTIFLTEVLVQLNSHRQINQWINQ